MKRQVSWRSNPLGYVNAEMLIMVPDCWANEQLRFQHFHTLLLNKILCPVALGVEGNRANQLSA